MKLKRPTGIGCTKWLGDNMGLITNEGIAVVKNTGRGMEIETYQSPVALVMSLMNSGSLGGGGCYGDDPHKAALDTLEKHLVYVRGRIEEHNKEDGGTSSDDVS
jgi:hypothetical protein